MKALGLILLLVFSVGAQTGKTREKTPERTWEQFNSTRLDYYYFNPDKMSKNGDLAEIWVKIVPKDNETWLRNLYDSLSVQRTDAEIQKLAVKFSHALDKYLANCKTRRMSRTAQVLYDRDGMNIGGFNISDETVKLYDVIPDSIGEAIWERGCK